MAGKKDKVTREEQARTEVGQTDISAQMARLIVWLFLALIVAVPLSQHVADISSYLQRKSQGHMESREVGWLPRSYDIFRLPELTIDPRTPFSASVLDRNARMLEHMERYEEKLENDSLLSDRLSFVQYWLLKYLGLGNENVYVGRKGWLFFRPSVDYAIGPGFLEKDELLKRQLEGNEYTAPPQPDPRKAILAFNKELADRGITLVLVPVPPKAVINPELFITQHTPRHKIAENPSYVKFLKEMRDEGVQVFDASAVLAEGYDFSGMPLFLETDTHWMPGAMEFSARRLSDYLLEAGLVSQRSDLYARRVIRVSNLGDIAAMLNLPEGQSIYSEQAVATKQVYDKRTGNNWLPSRSAEILVLGDSFSNIYSMPEMGWGETAGFVEQLGYYLQQPIDSIVQNDDGAHATREELARQLLRNPDRLAGKTVVIWEFASRELAIGDWRYTRHRE